MHFFERLFVTKTKHMYLYGLNQNIMKKILWLLLYLNPQTGNLCGQDSP